MLKSILDLLIPPECHICGEKLLPSEHFICIGCQTRLPRTHYHKRQDNPMVMRFAGRFPFQTASAHFFYSSDSPLAALIHDFKYRNFPSLARHLGRIMAQDLTFSGFLDDIDFIIPMPVHWTKKLRRGYNQSEYIAMGISDIVKIPISPALKAHRSHRTQTGFSVNERYRNVAGVFRLQNPEIYHSKRILLVDDVCTTGATMASAATAILEKCPDARLTLLSLACTF